MDWKHWVIIIPIFWFALGFILTAIVSDTSLDGISAGNGNFTNIDVSSFNSSDSQVGGSSTGGADLLDSLKIMFGFSIPTNSGFPQFLVTLISFINWLLVIIFGVAIYRVLNPFA